MKQQQPWWRLLGALAVLPSIQDVRAWGGWVLLGEQSSNCVCVSMCGVIAWQSTTNLRGNKPLHSPFSNLTQLKGMKNPWRLIRRVYRWLMSWYLKLVTCRLPSPSHCLSVFGCPPGLSASGSAGVPILLCISTMSPKNTHTHTVSPMPISILLKDPFNTDDLWDSTSTLVIK